MTHPSGDTPGDPRPDASRSRPTDAAPAGWLPAAREAGLGLGPPGYQLIALLQRGGQGAVYRALQLSTGREVALKVLPAGRHASEVARRRFEREVDLVSVLDHPNVVALLDRGEVDGHPWFAMRLVEGEDLDAWIAREKPSLRTRLELFLACCAGVAHAHARGVIHRDLKAHNIRVDPEGRPHVLDFGLGKPLDDGLVAPSSLTMDGHFVGTLAHAAPEQLSGDHARVDVRTDVHALGLILYWLLTERHPYPTEGDIQDVLAHVRATDPVAPSRIAKGLDRDLDTITLKALAKEPGRRYQTVDALADDVRRALAGEPIAARRDSGWYVLRKTAGRHRVLVGAVAAVLVILAASVVVLLRQRDAAEAARRLAEQESERARTEAAAADRISRVLAGIFDVPNATKAARPEDLRVVDMLERARTEVLPPLASEPAVAGRVAIALARAHAALGSWKDVEQLEPLFAPLVDDPSVPVRDRLDALQMQARLARTSGGTAAALPLDRKAAELVRLHDAELPPKYLPVALGRLGTDLFGEGRHDEAERVLDEAQRLAAERVPEDLLVRGKMLEMVLGILEARGSPEAEALREEVLGLYERHFGGPSAPAGDLLSFTALGLYERGEHLRAEEIARKALAMLEAVFDRDHVQIAGAHVHLGLALHGQGRDDEALEHFREALRMYRATAGEHVRTYAQVLENVAHAHRGRGDRAAEERAWREALAWQREHGTPEGVARIEAELARALEPR